MHLPISRVKFALLAFMAMSIIAISCNLAAVAQPTPIPTQDSYLPPTATVIAFPTDAETPVMPASPPPTITWALSATPTNEVIRPTIAAGSEYWEVNTIYQDALQSSVNVLREYYTRLVVHPVDYPELEINIGGEIITNSASTFKAIAVVFAIFKDPEIAEHNWGGRDSCGGAHAYCYAYNAIVFSDNPATASLLTAAVPDGNALDAFNSYMHDILLLPSTNGLTHWDYGTTTGVRTTQVLRPPDEINPERIFDNTFALDTLVQFYVLLETPELVDDAIERAAGTPGYWNKSRYPTFADYREAVLYGLEQAEVLMAVRDNRGDTKLEKAVDRALDSHPGLQITMYGKNGGLSPNHWRFDRWHLIDASIVTITDGRNSQRCIISYSSSSFSLEAMLDTSINYCISLVNAGPDS